MNYKKIKIEDFKFMSSNKLDTLLEGMTEKQKDNYELIYNLYRELFTEYIIQKLELKRYDMEISNSELNFQKVDLSQMDVFQYFSSDELNFFYIRNNLHVERLSEEELKILKKMLDEGKIELNDEATELIEKTYRKVIFEDVLNNGDKCLISFGPYNKEFFTENDSIVIGMRYNRYSMEGLSNDQEWGELDEKQRIYINSMLEKMRKNLKENSDVPISVIEYDDYSIIKKNGKIKEEEEER